MSKAARAAHHLAMGAEFPYDGRKKRCDPATLAARGILSDLMDRRGIKHELEGIEDGAIRREIVDAAAEIIRQAFEAKP